MLMKLRTIYLFQCLCSAVLSIPFISQSFLRAEDAPAEISILKENIRYVERNPNAPYFDPARCDVRLVGRINRGTAKRFQAVYEDKGNELNERAILFCLDSSGGNVSEALALARFIREQDHPAAIVTVVQEGAICQSACALVFMAGSGSNRLGPTPLRYLHPLGKLMFHSTYVPKLSEKDLSALNKGESLQNILDEFYNKGLQDVQEIVATFNDTSYMAESVGKAFVAPSLFLESFAQGPDEWICIDNIDKMGRWNIRLPQAIRSTASDTRKYYNVCRNVFSWSRDQSALDDSIVTGQQPKITEITKPPANKIIGGRNKKNADYPFDERFVLNASEFATKASTCVVEVTYEDKRKHTIFDMKVYYVYWDGSLASPVYTADTTALFDPETPIVDLLKPSSPLPKKASKSEASFLPRFKGVENHQMASCELRRMKDVDLNACEASCADDNRCYAFSYKKSARICSIKHTMTALRFDPLWVTGIRPGFEPQESIRRLVMDTQDMTLLTGKTIDINQVDSFSKCRVSCENSTECLGVTFTYSLNQCQRFETVESATPVDRNAKVIESVTSAVKRQR
jgi:hypothetical protein